MTKTDNTEFQKTSMMMDMYLSGNVVVTDFPTIRESRQKLLEYSTRHPEDEILVIFTGTGLVGLKGNYKQIYVNKNPNRMFVVMTNGQERWLNRHKLKLTEEDVDD